MAEIVDVDDVRMLDQRRDARLVEQHGDERLLRREVGVHEGFTTTSFSAKPAGPRWSAIAPEG